MDRLTEHDDRAERAAAVQKRIGERYQITVPISFAPPKPSRFRPKPKATEVITEDWSYTGLGFEAPTRDDLREAMPVVITIGPVTGQAVVRVVRPADDPAMSHYGVEFRDQALENVARELIDIHLDRVPGDRRNRSTSSEMPSTYRADMDAWT